MFYIETGNWSTVQGERTILYRFFNSSSLKHAQLSKQGAELVPQNITVNNSWTEDAGLRIVCLRSMNIKSRFIF